ELAGAAAVEGVVTMHGLPVARCRMVPEGGGVGVLQQRERIGEALGSSLSTTEHQRALEAVREWVAEQRLDRKERFEPSVSVVISTADRPDDLRTCLTALSAQRYAGRTEIVVVDNRPASGMTPPVVAEFPGVRLVSEPRAGASYGRNAGIHASTGEIIAMTDDDVIAPPEWLEAL